MYSAYRLSSLNIKCALVYCDYIEGDVDDKIQTFLFTAIALYHWHSYAHNYSLKGRHERIQVQNLVRAMEDLYIARLVKTQFQI